MTYIMLPCLRQTTAKVLERIAEAERAILARVKERFGITSDHIEEDQVLDDALYALRALRSCVAIQANAT